MGQLKVSYSGVIKDFGTFYSVSSHPLANTSINFPTDLHFPLQPIRPHSTLFLLWRILISKPFHFMGLFFITGETDVTIIIANSRKLMEQPGDFLMKKQSFVANKKGRIEDSYEFTNKLLGSGACGTVLKGRLKGQTNHSSWRAIKKIPKNKLQNRSKFLNEI